MPPLDGIRVVALEQAGAAPFAARQLADLGARVIKVERPGTGDFARHYDRTVAGQASYFVWLNRGKEAVVLDVKSRDGPAVLAASLARAAGFGENLGPGAAEPLRARAPRARAARRDFSVWPVRRAGWQPGIPRPAERAGVGRAVRADPAPAGPDHRRPVRHQPGSRRARRRADRDHRASAAVRAARRAGVPAGRGRDRQRAAAHARAVRRAPAAGGPGPVARGR